MTPIVHYIASICSSSYNKEENPQISHNPSNHPLLYSSTKEDYITKMPEDILHKIADHLPIEDFANFRSTSKTMQNIPHISANWLKTLPNNTSKKDWVELSDIARGLESHEYPVFHTAYLVKKLRKQNVSTQDLIDLVEHFPKSTKDLGFATILVTATAEEREAVVNHPEAGEKTHRAYEVLRMERNLIDPSSPIDVIAAIHHPQFNYEGIYDTLSKLVHHVTAKIHGNEDRTLLRFANGPTDKIDRLMIMLHPKGGPNVARVLARKIRSREEALVLSRHAFMNDETLVKLVRYAHTLQDLYAFLHLSKSGSMTRLALAKHWRTNDYIRSFQPSSTMEIMSISKMEIMSMDM